MKTTQRILLTGATGVIGRRVIPQLVGQGHAVTAVGRTPEKRAQLASLGATAVELDLFDGGAAERAMAGHDTVINLATHIPESTFSMMLPWSWKENDRIRREGSANLVAAAMASGVDRFIQESFAPIYEDGGPAWIDESWPVKPASNSRTVLDAERAVASFKGVGVVLRFAGFYGHDPMLDEMIRVVKKGWSPLPGPATAYWSSVAHEDAASAVVAALGVPAGIYNVCDDEPLTRAEWSAALAGTVGLPAPKSMPGWMVMGSLMKLLARSQRMSNRKFKDASGWRLKYPSARQGLREQVRAAKNERGAG